MTIHKPKAHSSLARIVLERYFVVCVDLIALIGLSGCGLTVTNPAVFDGSKAVSPVSAASIQIHGYVGGKDWSIGGASVQLYAIGTQGIASAATPLLSQPVVTEDNGNFSITGPYLCPASTSQLYVVANGGYSSMAVRRNNPATRLITMLGACNELSSSSLYNVNEVTTVAFTASLSRYMSSSDRLGYVAGDPSFQTALAKLKQLVDLSTGIAPGTGIPSGYAVQTAKIDTLASDLHACINSSGATGGSDPCGQLFAMTTLENGVAPTDTSAAALNVSLQDHLSLDGLYRLVPADTPFTPVLSEEPADWGLDLLAVPETPRVSPSSGSYAAGQPISIASETVTATIRYTTDGSAPTQESAIYSAPLQLSSAETVRAIAVIDGVSSSVGSATFSIASLPEHLVFSIQPANTTVGTALSPAPGVRVLDSTGALVTTPVMVTLQLNASAGVLSGTTSAMTSGGVATFPALSVTAAGSADTLTASAPHIASATSTPFNISAPVQTTLALALPSASVTAGNTLSGSIMLNQPAGNGGLAVRLTSSTPSVLSVASSTITIPAGQSQASFTASALSPGNSTLSAAASGCAGGSALVSITSLPEDLVFSIQPADTTVGTALSPAPGVRVLDSTGALVTTPVLVTLQLNSSAGVLSGTTSAMTSGGVATFPALSVTAAGSADTLTASAPHIASATSTPFKISAPVQTTLALALPSASVTAGNTLSGSIMLNQPAGTGGLAVRLTSSTPSVLSVASSTITIPAGQSQASFTASALSPGNSTLSAAASGCAGGSALVSITSLQEHLVFSVQPANTTVGTALSPAPGVRVLDSTGALVTTPVLVTLQLNSSAGVLSGTTSAMTSGGVATFPALSVTAAGSADTLTASAPHIASATSSLFNISVAPPALVIPESAISSGDLDGSTNWEWNHDPGTSGNSTGTSTYAVSSPSRDNAARGFSVNYSAHGGEIYHLSFANDTTATHFVYDTYIYLANPSQIANIEMDMNQVMANGQTVILGTQCASGSGTWEYTKVAAGGTHWYASNIPCHPKNWTANTWHHVRIATHRDSNGIATYDGVEMDGTYTAFENAAGPSALSLGWARGVLLLNFQLDGASAGAGTIQSYVDDLTIYRW